MGQLTPEEEIKHIEEEIDHLSLIENLIMEDWFVLLLKSRKLDFDATKLGGALDYAACKLLADIQTLQLEQTRCK